MKRPTNDCETDARRKTAQSKTASRSSSNARAVEIEQLLSLERKARTQAEAAALAKDEFIAVVTHELRSPLNAIRGWSHVLRHSGELLPVQLRALDAIDRNTQMQAHLVDDLLDSQRILCGKLELDLGWVPIEAIIEEGMESVQHAAQVKRIRVEASHDPSIGMVRIDADRMRQALVKLVANAVKFTPEDGIVKVRSARLPTGFALEVEDTGAGLDAEQLPGMFDRFNQADSSNTRRTNGLGLGLSLALQLVELHGGTIRVDSKGAGLGSKFTIELPSTAISEKVAQKSAGGDRSALKGKRIVIVEDDEDGREMLGLILRGADVELQSFDRARDAFEYLVHASAEEQPDALISDIAMPDEDGYAFIKRVRKLEGREHRPRIVALALTSFAQVEDRVCALKAGFDEHVAKPIDPDRVLRTLAQVLGLASVPTPT
ncbi:MAG: response regulator [Burkholderiales bacterium]|jgi:signal transduction histidine kinase/CheY-like chemotaxis protein|nr:response regulator [Burkholderiales bacterium]